MDANGLRPDAVRQLFGQLMMVNPSVEVYLLDNQGRIRATTPPRATSSANRWISRRSGSFIAGDALPILGDDPRSVDGNKVFSAAPLQTNGQPPSGYIYVVLLGEEHDALAARVAASSVLRTTLWSMALVALARVAGRIDGVRADHAAAAPPDRRDAPLRCRRRAGHAAAACRAPRQPGGATKSPCSKPRSRRWRSGSANSGAR